MKQRTLVAAEARNREKLKEKKNPTSLRTNQEKASKAKTLKRMKVKEARRIRKKMGAVVRMKLSLKKRRVEKMRLKR